MTVKELIEHLQTLPQDHPVVYRICSDYNKLEAADIKVVSAADKVLVQHHNMPDQVRDYNDWEYVVPDKGGWKERGHKPRLAGLVPKFVDAVIFPGN